MHVSEFLYVLQSESLNEQNIWHKVVLTSSW